MIRNIAIALSLSLIALGCGSQPAQESTAPAQKPPAMESPAQDIPMTNLPPITIGTYKVQPKFEEELKDGHMNVEVTGGEVAALRMWVGTEDASGVMVVKTAMENQYHHGHIEMPDPLPADAKLWIEIETPTGETLKGGTELTPQP